MGEIRAERTILFADVVDSTGLYEDLGTEETRRVLLECLGLMEETVGAFGGRVLDRIGDEIFCSFDDPDVAAVAASHLQERMVAGLAEGRFPRAIRIRVGLCHGPVLETPEGHFGGTIHTAARLVALAKAGQTLTTKETLDRLSPAHRKMQRFFDRVVLKGQSGEQDVHELLWNSSDTVVPERGRKSGAARPGVRAVVLVYGDREVRVDLSYPRLDIGRDAACGLEVEGAAVSRLHARVSWNRGRVRVDDVSSNGTAVEPEGETPVTLHREGTALHGHGWLRLGCQGPAEDAARVEYRVEA